jgi:hypothetical protein
MSNIKIGDKFRVVVPYSECGTTLRLYPEVYEITRMLSDCQFKAKRTDNPRKQRVYHVSLVSFESEYSKNIIRPLMVGQLEINVDPDCEREKYGKQ